MTRSDFQVDVIERMDTFSGKNYNIIEIHCGPYRRTIDGRKIKGGANFDYTKIAEKVGLA